MTQGKTWRPGRGEAAIRGAYCFASQAGSLHFSPTQSGDPLDLTASVSLGKQREIDSVSGNSSNDNIIDIQMTPLTETGVNLNLEGQLIRKNSRQHSIWIWTRVAQCRSWVWSAGTSLCPRYSLHHSPSWIKIISLKTNIIRKQNRKAGIAILTCVFSKYLRVYARCWEA